MSAAQPSRTAAPASSVGRTKFAVVLPDGFVEEVAARVAELLAGRPAPEPWIGVEQAAEHLACGKSRVYSLVSAGRIPHVKDGSRVLLRRSALDAWLADGGGIRP